MVFNSIADVILGMDVLVAGLDFVTYVSCVSGCSVMNDAATL